MDDYRDIGAKDFERYEKIRTRFSEIVDDFDLVTNSTPGTLMADPVFVVYDLARATGAPPELTVETATFKRAVIEQTVALAAGASSDTLVFPIVDGEVPFAAGNGRVERITGAYIDTLVNAATTTGWAYIEAAVNDGGTASPNGLPICRIGAEPGGALRSEYFQSANNVPASGSPNEINFPGSGVHPFVGLVISPQQNLNFNIVGSGTTDNLITFNVRLQYEYRDTT